MALDTNLECSLSYYARDNLTACNVLIYRPGFKKIKILPSYLVRILAELPKEGIDITDVRFSAFHKAHFIPDRFIVPMEKGNLYMKPEPTLNGIYLAQLEDIIRHVDIYV